MFTFVLVDFFFCSLDPFTGTFTIRQQLVQRDTLKRHRNKSVRQHPTHHAMRTHVHLHATHFFSPHY